MNSNNSHNSFCEFANLYKNVVVVQLPPNENRPHATP